MAGGLPGCLKPNYHVRMSFISIVTGVGTQWTRLRRTFLLYSSSSAS
jgi:hypothetical protein